MGLGERRTGILGVRRGLPPNRQEARKQTHITKHNIMIIIIIIVIMMIIIITIITNKQ